MTDYVTKPVNRAELLKTIRTCLEEGAAHQLRGDGTDNGAAAHGGTELPDSDDEVLDLEELRERCLGDQAFIDELLKIFVKKARSNVMLLSESMAAGRVEEVARVAHELKGSAGNVAAVRLSQAVGELEIAARTGGQTDYAELGERVTRELADCEHMIESILRSGEAQSLD